VEKVKIEFRMIATTIYISVITAPRTAQVEQSLSKKNVATVGKDYRNLLIKSSTVA
jgi:hypothetical protein